MNTERKVSSEEMSFSIALTSSVLLSLLKTVTFLAKEKGADPKNLHIEELINLLDQLFEETAAMSGPVYMSMGRERCRELFFHVIELSKPKGLQ